MKRLFKNIILLGVIATFVSIIISLLFPFYWGDNIQISKINYYKENSKKFNALFFGGSLEYRHIAPLVLKNNLSQKDIDFRAFNFGVDSHNFTQAITEADKVCSDIPNDSLKYIFISLSTEAYLSSFNLHTNKQICWVTPNTLSRLYRVLYSLDEAPAALRITSTVGYCISFFENAFNFGKLKDKLIYLSEKKKIDLINLGKYNDGFVPLELNENGQVANPETEITKYILMVSNIEYQKRADSINLFINDILKSYYDSGSRKNEQVDYLYQLCNDMIIKYNKKGIKVVFFLPPRVPSGYNYLMPLYNRIPNSNKFDLASGKINPEFYDPKFGFDNFHMNKQGAELYSKKMSIKIGELLSTN